MDLGLRGKNAIVTGGTGSIGGGCSTVLAEEGCNIIIVHRHDTPERDAFMKELAEKNGVSVKSYIADLTDDASIVELFKQLDEEYDHLDVLVNNACTVSKQHDLVNTDIDSWRYDQNGVINAVYSMSREFIKRALERDMKANVVNISAKSAVISHGKNKIGYTVNKGAINSFTMRVADDYCERGIRVNSILPGYVLGGIYTGSEEKLDEIAKEKGIRVGWATPRDMGNIVAFLASDRSRQIIGVNIDASGGTML